MIDRFWWGFIVGVAACELVVAGAVWGSR